MKRIYLDRNDCDISQKDICVRGDTFHYLKKVLRMKAGDVFAGFDGTGSEYTIEARNVENGLLEGVIIELKKVINTETSFNLQLSEHTEKRQNGLDNQ